MCNWIIQTESLEHSAFNNLPYALFLVFLKNTLMASKITQRSAKTCSYFGLCCFNVLVLV